MELHQVERYWNTRAELVSTLKKDATFSLMVVPEVKMEVQNEIYVIDVEESSLINSTTQGHALEAASTSNFHYLVMSMLSRWL